MAWSLAFSSSLYLSTVSAVTMKGGMYRGIPVSEAVAELFEMLVYPALTLV
jgi:hypothetical protein